MKLRSGILPIITVDRRLAKPLYRQVYEGYRDAILAGRLRPGHRLPSTRGLAEELGISRIPVLDAFDQLLAEGYCESRVGAGTFVATTLPGLRASSFAGLEATSVRERPARRVLGAGSAKLERPPKPWLGTSGPFHLGDAAFDQFPFATWARLLHRHARELAPAALRYADPLGYLPLRKAIVAYLETARALRCSPSEVMVLGGSQQALWIAAHALLDPGDRVLMEEPGYWGARDVFRAVRSELVPAPVDDEGIDIARGIQRAPRARLAYVTPSHQFPLGATLSASRRLQLLAWARKSGAWILEDDYDSEYRYESPPVSSLQGMDRDSRVVYIGTFSKVLFPALRLGYLVLPPDLVNRFVAVRRVMDIFPPTSPQAVLADFIAEGHFARHLRRMRALYRDRRSALVEALETELGDEVEVIGEEAGMHLVAMLTRRADDRKIAESAALAGLRTLPLSECYLGKATRQGLVMGYGGATKSETQAAARRLRAVIKGT